MSQYLLDCGNHGNTDPTCTIVPYSAPPAVVDHYSFAPGWLAFPVLAVVIAVVIGMSIVRYKAHEERGDTERTRINNPPKQCPTCGDRLES